MSGSVWWKLQNANGDSIEETYHVHGWKDNRAKMSILLTLFYSFNAIPVKILASFFVDTDQLILKFMWGQGPRILKVILKMKSKMEQLLFLISRPTI